MIYWSRHILMQASHRDRIRSACWSRPDHACPLIACEHGHWWHCQSKYLTDSVLLLARITNDGVSSSTSVFIMRAFLLRART
jgi:hypothetical protein